MHGIEREDAVLDLQFAEQLLRGRDLVGLFFDINMGQNHAGFDVESVQHLRRFTVVEIVETSPERLAIERDATSRRTGCSVPQTSGVAAKDLLDRLRIPNVLIEPGESRDHQVVNVRDAARADRIGGESVAEYDHADDPPCDHLGDAEDDGENAQERFH